MVIRPMIGNTPVLPTPNVWAIVAACVALLAVFLLMAFLICRKYAKGTDAFKHWPFYLSAVVGLILLLRFGATITTVKGMILTLLLLYASLSDFKKREVPDYISVMLLILAFVGFEPSALLSMLAGAAVVFIPQLATAMLTPNRSIGGADIKISTALALLLGAEKGIFALVVGMLLAVVITAISNKLNDRDQKQAFPLVPFLWIGATLAYLFGRETQEVFYDSLTGCFLNTSEEAGVYDLVSQTFQVTISENDQAKYDALYGVTPTRLEKKEEE